jgi:hypothetical protein
MIWPPGLIGRAGVDDVDGPIVAAGGVCKLS